MPDNNDPIPVDPRLPAPNETFVITAVAEPVPLNPPEPPPTAPAAPVASRLIIRGTGTFVPPPATEE
jgi:hypothetical protein